MSARFNVRAARTGSQIYSDGEQWRDASHVFDPESLRTLNNLRVQVSHDAAAPAVGYVVAGSAGRVRIGQHEYLTCTIAVDDNTATRIRRGELKGISMGYQCEPVRDSSGRVWQTQIRHEHLALLRAKVEQPRCGEHCAIGERTDMTHRTSDAVELDGANCGCGNRNDASVMLDSANGVIPDGSVAAMLDAAASQAGVTRQTIVDHLMSSVGGRVHLTFDHLRAATFECSLHGGKLLRGVQSDTSATVANDADDGSDESFRRMLARKL